MATLPTVASVVTGQDITATLWNNQVYNLGNFMQTTKPVCFAYQTVAQSIADGSLTALTFDSETIDTDSQHSTVSNTSRVVIGNTLGYYRVTGTYFNGTNVSGKRVGAAIGLNGAAQVPETLFYATGTAASSAVVTTIIKSTISTDYVELLAFQETGTGAHNSSSASPFRSCILVEYIGPLS